VYPSEACLFSSAFQINILFSVSTLPTVLHAHLIVRCLFLLTVYVEYKLTITLLCSFLLSRLPSVYATSPQLFCSPQFNVLYLVSYLSSLPAAVRK
jgi:hypothetical protein